MQHLQTWSVGLALLAALGASAVSWQRVTAQERRLADLRAELEGGGVEPPAPEAWRSSVERLQRRVAGLSDRVEGLAQARRTSMNEDGASGVRATPERQAESAPVDAEPTSASRPGSDPERDELAQLLETLLGPDGQLSGDPEDIARFWELAKGSSAIDDWMGELETQVELDPRNAELRMRLADAYVAKLYTASGPEQGRWGGKAEEAWRTVAELDPGHWEANFALGNNYAYYPDVMNKTKDAIERLERAREIQERMSPSPQHVQTYAFLSRLYRRQGKLEQARAILEEGILRHPDEAALREALRELDE